MMIPLLARQDGGSIPEAGAPLPTGAPPEGFDMSDFTFPGGPPLIPGPDAPLFTSPPPLFTPMNDNQRAALPHPDFGPKLVSSIWALIGISAAFLMATAQLLMRTTMLRIADPGRCLEEVNRQL